MSGLPNANVSGAAAGRRAVHLPRLEMEQLWAVAIVATAFIVAIWTRFEPHDFWWHLKAGEILVQTGHLPVTDTFSFTRFGQPYDNYRQFWLAEAAFYILYRAGGAALILFVHGLVITLAYGIMLMISREAAGQWRPAAAGAFFAVALGLTNWGVRPQSYVYPLAAALLWALSRLRTRPLAPLIGVPLLIAVWVNLHGSWIVGLLVTAIYALTELVGGSGEIRRSPSSLSSRLWAVLPVGLAACAAVLLNPRGLRAFAYAFSMTGDVAIQRFATEWAPSTFDEPAGGIFLAGLLVYAVVMAVSPRRPSLRELLCFVIFGLMGLRWVRAAVWFGLVLAPFFAVHVEALAGRWHSERPARPARDGRRGRALNWAIVAALLVASLASLPWFRGAARIPGRAGGLLSEKTPLAAVEYLLQHDLPPEVYHDVGFGSYLIWAAQPKYRTFVDTRFELFPVALFQDYITVNLAGRGWEEILSGWGVQTLVLSPLTQPRLIEEAGRSDTWTQVYQDQSATILVRRDASSSAR